MILNSEPILIQDTADASNMDKGLKFRHQIYLKNKKKMKQFRKYPFEENFFQNPFNNYNDNYEYDNGYRYALDLEKKELLETNMVGNDNENNDNFYPRERQLSDGALIPENEMNPFRNIARSQNGNTDRFKNLGNLIVSQDNQIFSNYTNTNKNNKENFKNNSEGNNNKGLIFNHEEGYRNN